MNEKRKIYIAGPYSSPDPCANTNRAIRMANALVSHGFVPFVPHLSLLWQTVAPKPYEDWIEYDLHWLAVCDVVLRMSGDSAGADKEVAEAKRRGIPVVHSIEELIRAL